MEDSLDAKMQKLDVGEEWEGSVFSIDGVLSKVLRCLNTKDLKSCRLVSSRWNAFVLKMFEKRGYPQIMATFTDEPDYDYDSDDDYPPNLIQGYLIVQRVNGATERVFLEEFVSFMDDTERAGFRFPCCAYSFLGGNLADFTLQGFLKDHGSKMTALVLDVGAQEVEDRRCLFKEYSLPHALYKFKILLVHQAPNLEFLRLNHLEPKEDWEYKPTSSFFDKKKKKKAYKPKKLFPNGTLLPKMKFLELPQDAPQWLVAELMAIMPNLVKCSRFE